MYIFAALVLAGLMMIVKIVPRNAIIVDGDTISVRSRKWRLAGYDSPEFNQPGGRQASAYLRKILSSHRSIAIITGRDAYGRIVAHVFTTKGPLSWRMILAGYGHPESLIGRVLCLVARIRRKGVWNGKTTVYSPRIWRHMHGQSSPYGYHRGRSYRKKKFDIKYDSKKGLKLPGDFIIP